MSNGRIKPTPAQQAALALLLAKDAARKAAWYASLLKGTP
jgi:hypothetical protein